MTTTSRCVRALALSVVAATLGCTAEKLRQQAVDCYNSGDVDGAIAKIDAAIADVQGNASSPGEWVMPKDDSCLYALEKAMMLLRRGDAGKAAELLHAARLTISDRRVNGALEFLGWDGTSDFFKSLGAGDRGTHFAPGGYEELTVYSLLALCSSLTSQQNSLPYVNEYQDIQTQLVESGSGLSGIEAPGSVTDRTLKFGSYFAGVVREAQANASSAVPDYSDAELQAPKTALCTAALERVRAGRAARQQGNGLIHVVYLLGRGPRLESTGFSLQQADPVAEVVNRAVQQLLDFLQTRLRDKKYQWNRALLVQLTQLPIPMPRLVPSTNRFAELSATVSGTGESCVAETFVDFQKLAQSLLDSERVMRITRAVIRRVIKTQTPGAIFGDWGLIAGLASTFAEDADLRRWGTLPSEIRVARLEATLGQHELDLGIARTKINLTSNDAYVLVIATDPGKTPTIVADEFSATGRGAQVGAKP